MVQIVVPKVVTFSPAWLPRRPCFCASRAFTFFADACSIGITMNFPSVVIVQRSSQPLVRYFAFLVQICNPLVTGQTGARLQDGIVDNRGFASGGRLECVIAVSAQMCR